MTRSSAVALSVAQLSVALLAFAASAQAQDRKLFVEGDIVRGNTAMGATGPICVLNSQFKRGENVVFRVRARNLKGEPLDDKAIKSMTVELSDGRKLPGRYGGHPPRTPTDFFWTAAWMIPEGYPTGTLGYKVTITDMEGNSQTWEPLKEYRSWPSVISGAVTYEKQPPQ
jgi:hypothetical protein